MPKYRWAKGGPKFQDSIAGRVKRKNIRKRWNADPEILASFSEFKAEYNKRKHRVRQIAYEKRKNKRVNKATVEIDRKREA